MLKRITEFSLTDIDVDNQRKRQLLNILLIGFAVIDLVIITLVSIAGVEAEGKRTLYIVLLSSLMSIMFVYWLNQKGYVVAASTIFITLITFAISASDSNQELLAGRSLIFFIIPIMMSSFLLESYSSFWAAAIITVEHLLLWNMEKGQIDFSFFGMVSFFLFALITWLAARSLEQALANAHEINLHLDDLVGERTQELAEANAYLANANERLLELDSLKSKFVSDVSHELRTPLSNISIYLEMLEHNIKKLGQTMPQKAMEFINIARQETARLTNLINDILDSSRLEQSMANPEMQIVDAHDLVQGVVETNRLNAESKGLALDLTLAPVTPSLLADAEQLKQVFTNLVANAVNYTEEGAINITTITRDDIFTFIIQDTGMGISSDDIPHLFERFYRGQQASRSSIPGTGLGLAISKEIIELHQGEIEIQSEINVGTTSIVTLPLHRAESEE